MPSGRQLEVKILILLRRCAQILKKIALSPLKLFQLLCFGIGFSVIILSLIVSLGFWSIFKDMPDVSKLNYALLENKAKQKIQSRLISSKTGHQWTAIDNMSRDLIYAVTLSEDAEFFEHDGVNYESIIRSMVSNIKNRKITQGGSTITQQTAKNLFLNSERSLVRKLKELYLTDSLEDHFDKNQILELYLNLAEFGIDLYGVRAAAKYYFAKDPAHINAAEGAFLAVLLPSPRKYQYSMFQNKNLTKSKKQKIRRILNDMHQLEFISDHQLTQYLNYNFYSGEIVPKRGLASQRIKK